MEVWTFCIQIMVVGHLSTGQLYVTLVYRSGTVRNRCMKLNIGNMVNHGIFHKQKTEWVGVINI